jgi:Fur family peroxide stress response transcriptional regulator
MARFEKVCRDAGVKLTPQRIEVFREVARTGDHPDAETVLRGVRRRLPSVSLDTVYRSLWLLANLGLMRTLGPSRERTRFDANLDRHHHFVCVQCGMMRDFTSDAFDGLEPPESVGEIGRAGEVHVEVRGVCHRCSKKRSKNKNTSKR